MLISVDADCQCPHFVFYGAVVTFEVLRWWVSLSWSKGIKTLKILKTIGLTFQPSWEYADQLLPEESLNNVLQLVRTKFPMIHSLLTETGDQIYLVFFLPWWVEMLMLVHIFSSLSTCCHSDKFLLIFLFWCFFSFFFMHLAYSKITWLRCNSLSFCHRSNTWNVC